jgi:hypothetical protein
MWHEWMLRTLLVWGLANPDALAAILSSSATSIIESSGKYIAQCNHGGKLTTYAWPQTASGQAIPFAQVQALLAQVAWMLAHYTPEQIQAYIDTQPGDTQVAVYWW